MRQFGYYTRTHDMRTSATRRHSDMGNTFKRRHWRPDYGQRNHDQRIVEDGRQLITGPELSRQTGVPLGAISKLARGGLLPVAGKDDRDYPLFELANHKVAEWLKAVQESSDDGSVAYSEATTDENGSPESTLPRS